MNCISSIRGKRLLLMELKTDPQIGYRLSDMPFFSFSFFKIKVDPRLTSEAVYKLH